MASIPILSGVYADSVGDYRTSYPRNMVPVPKAQGISTEYLRPADGIVQFASGPGVDRGGINWNGALYRVMGTSLVRVGADGTVTTVGDVGGTGQVTLDQGFGRIAIASGGSLYYYDGSALTQVTDPDLGTVLDVQWIAGYFMTTDGTSLVVTDLDDPAAVNPLKYGSSEADPDPIKAVEKLRNEALALNRFSIEPFQNIGGDGFPFQRIDGAYVAKGVIGTHAYVNLGDSICFMGSARNEAPSVYMMAQGSTEKVSTREIDTILQDYSEEVLSTVVAERRVSKNHDHILFHLPDQCLVFDANASRAAQTPVWFTLASALTGNGIYRARNAVWVYDKWIAGDPSSNNLGVLVSDISSHYGQRIGWEFGTLVLYADGNDGILNEVELVCLSGRVSAGTDPMVWTSYSKDGQTFSQEKATRAGRQGQRAQRICWRTQGTITQQRVQKFRGTSDAHITIAKLNVQFEPLHVRPGNG